MRLTRAKFYITGLTLLPGRDAGIRVELQAVSRGDRNIEWATATPVGNMSMTINNPAAAQEWDDFMREARATGKQPEVFIDIRPSDDGWAGDGHLYRESAAKPGEYTAGTCGECGLALDATLWEWDEEQRKNVDRGKRSHPND